MCANYYIASFSNGENIFWKSLIRIKLFKKTLTEAMIEGLSVNRFQINEWISKEMCFSPKWNLIHVWPPHYCGNCETTLDRLGHEKPFEFLSRVSNKNISEIFGGASELYELYACESLSPAYLPIDRHFCTETWMRNICNEFLINWSW